MRPENVAFVVEPARTVQVVLPSGVWISVHTDINGMSISQALVKPDFACMASRCSQR